VAPGGEVVENGVFAEFPDPLVVELDDEVAAGEQALDLSLAQQVLGRGDELGLVAA
jgi:hypothetical protein